MTYVVTENCIRCKYMDCVEVCPVDCFYVGENMLVIHPDECIDCGVCEPECPVEAIVPDSDDKAGAWLEQNRTYAALVAEHHPQGRATGGCRRVEGQAGQGQAVRPGTRQTLKLNWNCGGSGSVYADNPGRPR